MIQCTKCKCTKCKELFHRQWSLERHGDPKNAYDIVVDARIKVTYMYNIKGK